MFQKRNQFKAPQRFVPHRETEEEKDQKLKYETSRLKKEREKFTNVKAPEIEKLTHFGVTGSLDIGGEEEKEETGGFSLLSMFGRQVETDDENVNEEQSDENMEEELSVRPKPAVTEVKKR